MRSRKPQSELRIVVFLGLISSERRTKKVSGAPSGIFCYLRFSVQLPYGILIFHLQLVKFIAGYSVGYTEVVAKMAQRAYGTKAS